MFFNQILTFIILNPNEVKQSNGFYSMKFLAIEAATKSKSIASPMLDKSDTTKFCSGNIIR